MAEPTKVEPGKYSKQFPELGGLLGGYFHEDMFDGFEWKGYEPNFKSLIRYHKSIQSEKYLIREISELREFLVLSQSWDEDKLEDVLLYDFSGSIYAPGIGITYREFLEGILKILEEPMEKTRSEFVPKFIG